jgi:autotransporter-associated beta strand protein
MLTMSGGLVIVGGTLARGVDGTIHLNPGGTLQIGSGSASGVLGVSSITNNGTLIFDRATDYVFSGAVSGSGAIVKRGGGMLTLSGSSGIGGPTVIRQGVVQLGHATALSSSTISPLAGGTLSLSAALRSTVGGLDPGAGGLVDVGNGGVTVASGLSSADLVAAILSGRADGSWSGTSGITSSVAAADVARGVARGVGWLDDGEGSVVVAYAASGDTNVDWIIDVLDAANVIASGKYSTGLPASWLDGDFNYDGVVDILDASEFTSTGLYNTGPYNAVESLLPEPAGGASAAVCLAALWAAAQVLPRLRRRAAASRRRPAIVTTHEAGSGTAATLGELAL